VFRWLKRRKRASEPDPAEALRAKLEESRTVADDRDDFESGETPVDRADPEAKTTSRESDPEARRRALHDQTRSRIDELSGREEG
jgi:hypothetical protein